MGRRLRRLRSSGPFAQMAEMGRCARESGSRMATASDGGDGERLGRRVDARRRARRLRATRVVGGFRALERRGRRARAHRRGSQLAGLAYSAYEAARARLLVAQGHRTAGHHDAARLQLQAAASTFERLGARPDLARVQGEPGSLRPSDALITPPAREVLSLVADGLTDRQIAEQLVVSPHTVHRHVANIRNRLGQPTRAATVAHAAKLGLR